MAKQKFPITRKEFSQILRKRGVIKYGEPYGGADTCPLAQAIKYKYPTEYARVAVGGAGNWAPNGNWLSETLVPLPGWAKRFVAKFDASNGTSADAKRIQPLVK